jgi:hypothetical protein
LCPSGAWTSEFPVLGLHARRADHRSFQGRVSNLDFLIQLRFSSSQFPMAQGVSPAKWFLVSVIALGIAVGIYAWVEEEGSKPAAFHHTMTASEKAYVSEIEVSAAQMSAATNGIGTSLYYLDAQISNKGTEIVRQVDLNLTFMDPFGDVVSRQMEHAVTPATPPLKPGQTKPLHFVFERLPDAWNQGPPKIAVSSVSF